MPEARIYRTTADMYEMLRQRYDAQAWSLMFEVADATGARQRRWADAVAMGLWPSRGLCLHGHEVKASRSDWVKELRTPQKADAIARYCDYWWLVAADSCIVHDGELPENWGLLAPDKSGKLKTVKDAPRLVPCEIDRDFLAALLRSASKPTVALNAKALQDEYARGRKAEDEHHAKVVERLTKAHDDLLKRITEFEGAAGFSISSWRKSAADVGAVVKDVLAGVYDRDRDDLRDIQRLASGIVARINDSGLLESEAAA